MDPSRRKTIRTDFSGAKSSVLYFFLHSCVTKECTLFIEKLSGLLIQPCIFFLNEFMDLSRRKTIRTDFSGAKNSGLYFFLHSCVTKECTLFIEKLSGLLIQPCIFFLNEFMDRSRRKTIRTDFSGAKNSGLYFFLPSCVTKECTLFIKKFERALDPARYFF